jgi:hypothetical protein
MKRTAQGKVMLFRGVHAMVHTVSSESHYLNNILSSSSFFVFFYGTIYLFNTCIHPFR